eukprot:Phypoly_transcript_09271.p1 GENE.Phypoly_transcript_09271~~Phypoly_transcript_09271.p1  ORF type:complete len:330 (+),score=50.86 Phypoly_transcript_09271:392-1381(+)
MFGRVVKANRDENCAISPFVAAASILVAMNGASDDTCANISKLGFSGVDLQTLNSQVALYTTSLANSGLFFANSLWMPTKGVQVKANFKQKIAENLSADIYTTVDQTVLQKWVAYKTKANIQTIQLPAATSHGSLVSAIYYKGRLGNADPTSPNGDVFVTIREPNLECYEEPSGLQAAWIPYNGGFSGGFGGLVLLPPTTQHPADFVANLNAAKWAQLRSAMKKSAGQVVLPKFSLSTDIDLIPALRQMGIDNNYARFPNIVDSPFAIGSVAHRVVVEWQDIGSNSQAQHLVCPFDMKVTRPFIFAICDKEGYPLLLSVIVKPTVQCKK